MWQMEKITGAICNVPVDNIDFTNLLPKTAGSNGLVIVKLKRKVEYRGHVLFEAVRPDLLRRVLSYLKKKNYFYKDIIVRNDLEEVIPHIESRFVKQCQYP